MSLDDFIGSSTWKKFLIEKSNRFMLTVVDVSKDHAGIASFTDLGTNEPSNISHKKHFCVNKKFKNMFPHELP